MLNRPPLDKATEEALDKPPYVEPSVDPLLVETIRQVVNEVLNERKKEKQERKQNERRRYNDDRTNSERLMDRICQTGFERDFDIYTSRARRTIERDRRIMERDDRRDNRRHRRHGYDLTENNGDVNYLIEIDPAWEFLSSMNRSDDVLSLRSIISVYEELFSRGMSLSISSIKHILLIMDANEIPASNAVEGYLQIPKNAVVRSIANGKYPSIINGLFECQPISDITLNDLLMIEKLIIALLPMLKSTSSRNEVTVVLLASLNHTSIKSDTWEKRILSTLAYINDVCMLDSDVISFIERKHYPSECFMKVKEITKELGLEHLNRMLEIIFHNQTIDKDNISLVRDYIIKFNAVALDPLHEIDPSYAISVWEEHRIPSSKLSDSDRTKKMLLELIKSE